MTNYTDRDSEHPNLAPERYYKYTKSYKCNLTISSLLNGITKMMSCDLAAVDIISFCNNNDNTTNRFCTI